MESLKSEFVDTGYSAVPRVFQLVVENQFEPEIIIVISAGKSVNDEQISYHVIFENAYGTEAGGEYKCLKKDELEKILGKSLEQETDNDIVEKIMSKDIEPLLCNFSESLIVINVTEDTFETLGAFITQKPVDIDFLKTKRYFNVMTNAGLIIFKKIIC